jgi:transketolase
MATTTTIRSAAAAGATASTGGQPAGPAVRPQPLMAALSRLTGDEKHEPSAVSTLDVLWVLYDRVLRVSPSTVDAPDRDRFLLSKGHGPAAYYAVLATKGFFPLDRLDGMGGRDSRLGYHPDRTLVPGVEIGSGSLGHGLPIAVGTALGLHAQGYHSRVYVLVGDAELDEGANHEAIAFAGATALAGLTVVVIDNHSARYRPAGGLTGLFTVHGWSATTVDGRDHDAIERALAEPHPDGPRAVVAVVEPRR